MSQFQKSAAKTLVRRFFAFCLIVLLTASTALTTLAQRRSVVRKAAVKGKINTKSSRREREREEERREKAAEAELKKLDEKNALLYPDGERPAEKMPLVPKSDEKTVIQIMAEQAALGYREKSARQMLMEQGLLPEKEGPNRKNLPDGLGAQPYSRFPYPAEKEKPGSIANLTSFAPQTLGTQFDGATGPTETGAFPPDTQGVVGPTQFVVFLNGRIRTFNKTTGVADGVLNVDSDVFFASVMTPPGAGEVTFTTDPNVRFDRHSGRWFLNIIDVTLSTTTGATTRVNRVIIAVSDAASNGVISGTTTWTFYQFQGDATLFTDYQSFGIDRDAMYIGGNMFTLAGGFSNTKAFVIPKAPALTGSPLTVWAFPNLLVSSAGPFSPRGVDNPDPANTGPTAVGYFIGVDNATFNTLMLRRVTNPGSLGPAPTISANISIATGLTTRFPVLVPHLGNTGGNNGRLDALDDRLYAATLRNGRLWTAHNIGVNNTGVAGATNNRNAARWYEIQNLNATPSVVQAGTLFDNNATNDANQRNYWIPSIMVSGQGHVAMGASIAGTNERINAFTTGRLAGDTLGTMRDGPGGTAFPGYTSSSTAYNPPGDPGGTGGRRWGDYSFTSLDPLDDMTMWTIQEYCNGANTYGVRVVRLIAPPPASIANGPDAGGLYNVAAGQASVNVTIAGTSVSGSGFYDPGANLAAPARPFNHIAASVSGTNVIVNSVTYNSPTSITLNLNTVGATLSESNLSPDSLRNLTITNPDGQSVVRNSIINIVAPSAAGATITGRITDPDGTPVRGAAVVLFSNSTSTNYNGVSQADGSYVFQDIPVGASYVVTPSKQGYSFAPENRLFSLVGDIAGVDFTATPDAPHARAGVNDFDGDAVSDYAIFRPNEKVWYVLQSTTNTMRTDFFGLSSDTPVAADYDGDGKTDVAMWRESSGTWYVKQSSDGSVAARSFGVKNDIPVYGYFDADTRVDLAIYRPSTATWWILDSTTGNSRAVRWGLATDKPVPQDYDGDGLTDLAVYRPGNGTWYIVNSGNGSYTFRQFGIATDKPVLGDFDGDGKADPTVYRASEGTWHRLESAASAYKVARFGLGEDLTVAGDYDGDGKSDIALFRESDSVWYVMTSLNQSFAATRWGKTGDIPIVAPAMK